MSNSRDTKKILEKENDQLRFEVELLREMAALKEEMTAVKQEMAVVKEDNRQLASMLKQSEDSTQKLETKVSFLIAQFELMNADRNAKAIETDSLREENNALREQISVSQQAQQQQYVVIPKEFVESSYATNNMSLLTNPEQGADHANRPERFEPAGRENDNLTYQPLPIDLSLKPTPEKESNYATHNMSFLTEPEQVTTQDNRLSEGEDMDIERNPIYDPVPSESKQGADQANKIGVISSTKPQPPGVPTADPGPNQLQKMAEGKKPTIFGTQSTLSEPNPGANKGRSIIRRQGRQEEASPDQRKAMQQREMDKTTQPSGGRVKALQNMIEKSIDPSAPTPGPRKR